MLGVSIYVAFDGLCMCILLAIAQVVDLLIAMANSAAHSSRADLILDPFPSIVDPGNINTLALDPQV